MNTLPGDDGVAETEGGAGPSIHWLSLLAATAIMLIGSIYPLLFADAQGQADHSLAVALFWSMSAGFVRGVGFVAKNVLWRWVFSGWACAAGLLLAAWLRWGI
jgi:predicted membrane protein